VRAVTSLELFRRVPSMSMASSLMSPGDGTTNIALPSLLWGAAAFGGPGEGETSTAATPGGNSDA
jgi:hypothetical protein